MIFLPSFVQIEASGEARPYHALGKKQTHNHAGLHLIFCWAWQDAQERGSPKTQLRGVPSPAPLQPGWTLLLFSINGVDVGVVKPHLVTSPTRV